MLQQVENDPQKLLVWLKTFPNLFTIAKRGKLVLTKASKTLLIVVLGTQIALISCVVLLIGLILPTWAAILFFCTPVILVVEITVLASVGNFVLAKRRAPLLRAAHKKFAEHPGKRIAVLGSYGKTSMKELLNTVLGSKMDVATTPGNKNVVISHARWSKTLKGTEDVLIIEYGEGQPGDISKLASLSAPTYAVITGLAPNHLDHYRTLDALKDDFRNIEEFVKPENIYINDDKTGLAKGFSSAASIYDQDGIDGWRVSNVNVEVTGISFKLSKDGQLINVKSGLLGRHNIGPLCAVAAIALRLGFKIQEIEHAMTLTRPFEHRMQPRQVNGAWIIDDAYNGNLEGFKAGLALLGELDAKRKIYVTPGLVDQGEETQRVHVEIGKAIANAKPGKVVLMKNSVTKFISDSMKKNGYQGKLEIIEDPLEYYQNIDQFLASGDLVMLQNDWTDNYN